MEEEVQTQLLHLMETTARKDLKDSLQEFLQQKGFADHVVNRLVPQLTFEGSLSKGVFSENILAFP